MHLQHRRQEPPVHCIPRRSQGTSAKNRKELPDFGISNTFALRKEVCEWPNHPVDVLCLRTWLSRDFPS
jgi:hypothetical protein